MIRLDLVYLTNMTKRYRLILGTEIDTVELFPPCKFYGKGVVLACYDETCRYNAILQVVAEPQHINTHTVYFRKWT